ncbi:MAG: hypothetical protein AB1938_24030 [Myxococcota bacterium]
MGIPIGNRYSATATGAVWRPVTCEHCGAGFAYLMKRVGVGAASSLLWLRNGAAAAAARDMAQESLAAQLESDWDAVPCPGCGALQSSMLYRWRKQRFQAIALALGGVLALCCAVLFALVLLRLHPSRAVVSGLRWTGVAAVAGMGVAWWWTQRLDPNARAKERAGRPGPDVLHRAEYEQRVAEGRLRPLSWARAHLPPA